MMTLQNKKKILMICLIITSLIIISLTIVVVNKETPTIYYRAHVCNWDRWPAGGTAGTTEKVRNVGCFPVPNI